MKGTILDNETLSSIRGGHDKDYNLGHNLGRHLRKGTETFGKLVEKVVSILNPLD